MRLIQCCTWNMDIIITYINTTDMLLGLSLINMLCTWQGSADTQGCVWFSTFKCNMMQDISAEKILEIDMIKFWYLQLSMVILHLVPTSTGCVGESASGRRCHPKIYICLFLLNDFTILHSVTDRYRNVTYLISLNINFMRL